MSSYDSGETRCVAVHAEANALLYCDREDLAGATIYVTRAPCVPCSKLIAAAGITCAITPDGVWDSLSESIYTFCGETPIREYNWLEQRC